MQEWVEFNAPPDTVEVVSGGGRKRSESDIPVINCSYEAKQASMHC